MRYLSLITCLFLASYATFSQPSQIFNPTQFDKFILDDKIEWAAYIIDTANFPSADLSKQLLASASTKKINVTRPLSFERGAVDKITYLTSDEVNKLAFAPADPGEIARPFKIDSNHIQIATILYLEAGRLFCYVPWVSTQMAITTSSDMFIGMTELFSTGINFKNKFKNRDIRKAEFLGEVKATINAEAFKVNDMLKETYGRNLVLNLYATADNKKNQILDWNTGKSISSYSSGRGQSINFSPSDSLATVETYGDLFSKNGWQLSSYIDITEQWYYHRKSNRLLCKIPEAILYSEAIEAETEKKMRSPAIRIKFAN